MYRCTIYHGLSNRRSFWIRRWLFLRNIQRRNRDRICNSCPSRCHRSSRSFTRNRCSYSCIYTFKKFICIYWYIYKTAITSAKAFSYNSIVFNTLYFNWCWAYNFRSSSIELYSGRISTVCNFICAIFPLWFGSIKNIILPKMLPVVKSCLLSILCLPFVIREKNGAV